MVGDGGISHGAGVQILSDACITMHEDFDAHVRRAPSRRVSSVQCRQRAHGIAQRGAPTPVARRVPRFGTGPNEGNCHDVALALMTDLVVAGQAAGWHWVARECATLQA